MKIVLHTVIWLAVLVAGILAAGAVFKQSSQGGTGNGAGFFDYSFRSTYFPAMEGDPSISCVELEGQAPRRFKVYGGVSPIYNTMSMKWSLNSGYEGRPEGHVLLDLNSDTICDGEGSVPLDSEHLIAVIGIPDRPANRVTLQYLLNVLEDCHTGQLPRPSHHGYNLKDPMPGRMQHVALGFMVNYSILTWVGTWILAIPVFYTIRRITSRGAPTGQKLGNFMVLLLSTAPVCAL
jgi:hypothetical protein